MAVNRVPPPPAFRWNLSVDGVQLVKLRVAVCAPTATATTMQFAALVVTAGTVWDAVPAEVIAVPHASNVTVLSHAAPAPVVIPEAGQPNVRTSPATCPVPSSVVTL
jgi:hypothetical protein